MQIQVTLTGALKEKTPEGGTLEVPDGASIDVVLLALDVADSEVQIVMINGKPRPDRSSSVAEGDQLTVLAPVGGG